MTARMTMFQRGDVKICIYFDVHTGSYKARPGIVLRAYKLKSKHQHIEVLMGTEIIDYQLASRRLRDTWEQAQFDIDVLNGCARCKGSGRVENVHEPQCVMSPNDWCECIGKRWRNCWECGGSGSHNE